MKIKTTETSGERTNNRESPTPTASSNTLHFSVDRQPAGFTPHVIAGVFSALKEEVRQRKRYDV